MIVSFQQPDTGGETPDPVVLAPGWATRESASSEPGGTERDIQTANLLRAATALPLDRGQSLETYAFSVTRKFDTPEDMFTYLSGLAASVACDAGDTVKNGTLLVEGEDSVWSKQLNQAVCRSIKHVPAIASVVVTFTFVGAYWSIPE